MGPRLMQRGELVVFWWWTESNDPRHLFKVPQQEVVRFPALEADRSAGVKGLQPETNSRVRAGARSDFMMEDNHLLQPDARTLRTI